MKNAFTLIEMMIVVAILAILAAIAIPQYQKYKDPQEYARREAIRAHKDFYSHIITDPDTHCQYFKGPNNEIIPRRDALNNPVCN